LATVVHAVLLKEDEVQAEESKQNLVGILSAEQLDASHLAVELTELPAGLDEERASPGDRAIPALLCGHAGAPLSGPDADGGSPPTSLHDNVIGLAEPDDIR
jgi:hypothetical protein